MYLDRVKTLSLFSALALSLVFACSSKKNNGDDDTAAGGSGFVTTGGGSSLGGGNNGGDTSLPSDYCGGLLQGRICGQTRLEADVRQVNMLLVIDLSGSMNDAPTSGAQSKWAQMKLALSNTLKTVGDDIDFGLELFPYSGDITNPGVNPDEVDPAESCKVPTGDDPNVAIAVDIAPGVDHVNQNILPVIDSAVPAGGTPTTKALQQAYAYFVEGRGKDLPGTKWVLLATDGGPNCNTSLSCEADGCTQNIDCKCGSGCNATLNCCAPSNGQDYGYICLDDRAVIAQVQKLEQAGIRTFVVGVPGTEKFTATLNAMADVGGKPKEDDPNGDRYYAVSAANSLEDLQAAFSTITTQLVKSCDVELKESPQDPKRVIVAIDCAEVPSVPDNTPESGGESGYWIDYSYTDTPAHLKLTGDYCSRIRTQGANNLDVITGCQGIF